MTEQDKFEAFMQKVMQRPLPNNPMARIRTLAKELAEGASLNLWLPSMWVEEFEKPQSDTNDRTNVTNYIEQRWGFANAPNLTLMNVSGYIKLESRQVSLTRSAVELLDEVEPVEIFISYRRKDSSAFALLVLSRLKDFDLNAFLDMSIRPGDNWHAYIKEQIQQRDYFILLLGKETLKSDVVKQEILWALEAGAEIIPIWHSGFEYKKGEIDLPPEIDKILGSNHSIRVLEESALAYNNAIVELLNRFGVTP